MPQDINHTGINGVPNLAGSGAVMNFMDGGAPVFEERNFVLADVTRDASGTPLGNCTVHLFNAATNALEQTTTSDASGNYSFTVDKTQLYYTREYKSGAPDVAGTSVNTLAGS